MPLAALLALTVLAAEPAAAQPPAPTAPAASTVAISDDDSDGVPSSAPTDDYGFVAWCYGALDEYLDIYEKVKPDLKAIDKLFGTPVKEAQPYASDVAEEHKALLRFGAAITAAEKASPHPIAPRGVAAMGQGRSIWAVAETLPSRKLADAWLFWGVPKRCETTAASLKLRSVLMGQALKHNAPNADEAPAPVASTAPPPTATTPPAPPPPPADAPAADNLGADATPLPARPL